MRPVHGDGSLAQPVASAFDAHGEAGFPLLADAEPSGPAVGRFRTSQGRIDLKVWPYGDRPRRVAGHPPSGGALDGCAGVKALKWRATSKG
jgi:hypothetical protein